MTALTFPTRLDAALKGAKTLLLLVPQARARDGWLGRVFGDAPWAALLEKAARDVDAGRTGRAIATLGDRTPARVVLALLPDAVSRHNAPSRADAARALALGADLSSGPSCVVAAVDAPEHAPALAYAVSRALPLFSRSSAPKKPAASRDVRFLALDGRGRRVPVASLDEEVTRRIRWAASLVDAPPAEMDTAGVERAVRAAARGIRGLKVSSIVADRLLAQRLGGIHAVGRAASAAPRLLLLEWSPARARRRVGLVGKGVVYDTGGLALKPRDGMVGMKADMAGAAAVVGATLALAASGHRDAIVCAAPLAENAIGPGAYRNDDILTLHSGKTVEINNTDAEGRLLLADAVSWVARRKKVDLVVDLATLTGAQPISTGFRHAGIVSNREALETAAFRAGRRSGDLVFPMPFAPEFFQEEFKSKVADMKNSVANRANAQSSCAAQFVHAHLDGLDLPWLHVDMAGPAVREERATGYGVALLATLLSDLDEAALAK